MKVQTKERLNVRIRAKTYRKLNDFCKENELVTTQLSKGTIVEMGLGLFFKEIQKRPLEDIAVEFISDLDSGADNE
jgi:hypothetical protein